MAVTAGTETDWENYDKSRMVEAVREIAASPNLRFLIAQYLLDLGHTDTCFASNALEMARRCGQVEAATAFINLLENVDPALYPNMILESQNENLERNPSVS